MPLDHGHGRATSGNACDIEFISQSFRTGQPDAKSAVGAEAVLHCGRQISDAGADVASDNPNASAAIFLDQIDHDLAVVSEANDIAYDLRHGRSQGRQLNLRQPEFGCNLTDSLSRGDDVGVDQDRNPE